MALLPLWFEGLTPELRKRAEKELGETPEVKAMALLELRRMIAGRNDLNVRTDDIFLLRFLRMKKFDTPKAFKIVCSYNNFKVKHAGGYACLKPSIMKNVMDTNAINYAHNRHPDGSHVAMFRICNYDPSICKLQDVFGTFLTCGEILYECEVSQVSGTTVLIDLQGITYQHVTMFLNLSFAKFIISTLTDCFPERIKAVHYVRQPASITAFYSVVKYFMKKKLYERIVFHGDNLKSLHKHIPKELLPEEFGGTQGPYNNKEFTSNFFSQYTYTERIKRCGNVDSRTS